MSRSDEITFNPEKFLFKEKKKAASRSKTDFGNVVMLTFSKGYLTRFLPSVATRFPDAFYSGPDQAKTAAVFPLWSREVAKELEMRGIGPDPKLIHLLVGSIVLGPEWKRMARSINRVA